MKLAYFTGSNRACEDSMIRTMIRSARACGVVEDFHAFYPIPVEGAINHQIDWTFPWNNHMGKLDLLLKFEGSDYTHVCWLDTDNYFVRHPGDLSELVRGNPCWILMEGDIEKSARADWWGMPLDMPPTFPRTGKLVDIMRRYRPDGTLWTTNGGMWIVRVDAIREFYERCYGVFRELMALGHRDMADEPPLAIAGQAMVEDPESNTFDKCCHIWASDWNYHFKDKLPDGNPWPYSDWISQVDKGRVNPAIVHAMRSKTAQIAAGSIIDTTSAANQNPQSQVRG
jgi:hypothetical protein